MYKGSIEKAEVIAYYYWYIRLGEILRIGEVAKSIKEDLEAMGMRTPKSVATIKRWIQHLAPEEARIAGAPKTIKY